VSKNFTEVFLDAVDTMEADAKKVGMNLTSVCKASGIGRATPDLWRKKVPKTVVLLTEMQDVVRQRKAELKK
jgi:hypothetical protein